MARFRHLVVAVDFEEASREACEAAVDLARAFEARLTLVHVWDVPAFPYAGLPYLPLDMWSAVEQAARNQLAATLRLVQERSPGADADLERGEPAAEILATTERLGADLVVMGTHGRRGLRRVLLGSVAERVVRLSRVPVLTVREADPTQAVP